MHPKANKEGAILAGLNSLLSDYLVREWSVEGLQFIGAIIDKEINEEFEHVRGKDVKLSTPDSTVEIWCIPTNEELAIAKETYTLCK